MTDRPFLKVLRGNPTPQEIAALVAAVIARTATPPAPEPRRTPWSDPSRLVRRPLPHGPGAWRSANRP